MKKFLSIVAVLAMLFALTVPALAAGEATPSVEAKTEVTTDATVEVNGQTANVEVKETTTTADQKTALDAVVKDLGDDIKVGAVVDVELKTSDGTVVSADYFDNNEKLTVAFTYNMAGDVEKVLYWNATDQKWDEATFRAGDGTIEVDFEHLCAVAFVLKEVKNDPAAGDQSKPGKPGKPGSPQTGYSTTAWTLAAMAMILCAGFCFVSARKKVTA